MRFLFGFVCIWDTYPWIVNVDIQKSVFEKKSTSLFEMSRLSIAFLYPIKVYKL